MTGRWMILMGLLCLSACGPPLTMAKPNEIQQLERLNTGRLSYLRAGDPGAPRVIYIHGTPGDATNFADYLTNPVPGLEAISVDRLGFGQSAPEHAEPSFAAQAASIEPLLVQRDGRWPILVGHSLGGPIAAQLAAEHPDRVSGLVILAGSLDPDLEKLRWYNHAADSVLLRWALRPSLRHANDEVLDARGQTEALAPLLTRVEAPVLILHSTDDSLVPYGNVAYMQRMLTNAAELRVVTFDGEGHFLPWKRATEVREAVAALRDRPLGQR